MTPLRSGQGHLDLSRSILTSSQAHRISIEERPAGHLSRSKATWASTGRQVKEQSRAGYADSVMNDGPNSTQTYPIRAPRTRHLSPRGNFTNPHFTFPIHEHSFIHSHACIHTFIHSFIHSSIHSSHTSKHCICNCCIIMLRHERQPTEVRRSTCEGLEAASCQTELGEKNLDEPQWPCPTPLRSEHGHLDLSRSILTSSQAHIISIEERPAGHLSRSEATWASAGRWVKE